MADPHGDLPPRAVLTTGDPDTRYLQLLSTDTDVTGDGKPDVVALGRSLCVWEGDPSRSGRVLPTRTLPIRHKATVQVVTDVTGDGIGDVVARSILESGSSLVAEIYAGGDALRYDATPVARLLAPSPWQPSLPGYVPIGVADLDLDGRSDLWVPVGGAGNGLLFWSGSAGLRGDVEASVLGPAVSPSLVDLQGDGALDLVSVRDASIELRAGGPGLADRVDPTTVLHVSDPRYPLWAPRFVDMTGDGRLDVLAQEEVAHGPEVESTRIHVWTAPFAPGAIVDDLTLEVPGRVSVSLAQIDLLAVADVTGDGVADPIAHRRSSGETFVWTGGTLAPTPTSFLPATRSHQPMALADLDGDGVLDLYRIEPSETVDGRPGAGLLRVWKGGPTLVGHPAPLVELTASHPSAEDGLGAPGIVGVRLVDLQGDGFLDVVAAAGDADVAGTPDVGALFYWAGPIDADGAADGVLAVPGAVAGDGLGR